MEPFNYDTERGTCYLHHIVGRMAFVERGGGQTKQLRDEVEHGG